MFKNKYVKILILVLCIIFVIMTITTSIMAGNTLHTEHCNDDHCSICGLIQIATGLINNIDLIVFSILIISVLIFLIQLVEKMSTQARKLTLVELKVIQLK